MATFLTTVALVRQKPEGDLQQVKEQYLVEGDNVSDAANKLHLYVRPYSVNGEMAIDTISKSNVKDIVLSGNEEPDVFYRAKIAIVTINVITGTEKLTPYAVIVEAASFDQAYRRLKDSLKGSMSDIKIISLTETKILEYVL